MSIGAILLGLALIIGVGVYIARPFLLPPAADDPPPSAARRQALLAQKEERMDQLRLLELDYSTGKVPEEIYQAQKQQGMAEAAAILQQLEEMGATPAAGDEAIEAAIAAVRQRRQAAAVTPPLPAEKRREAADAAIEAAIAAARGRKRAARPVAATPPSQRPRPASRFCTQCGQPFDPGDKFCAHCGQPLEVAT